MAQLVSQSIPKILLTLLFIVIIGFAAWQIYGIWSIRRITLAPFDYQSNGAQDNAQGKAFSLRVYQEMRMLQILMHGSQAGHGSTTLDPLPSSKVTTLELKLPLPEIIGKVPLPQIPKPALAGLELKVQGVDLVSWANGLYEMIDRPEQITGSVDVEGNGLFSTLVEWQQAGIYGGDDVRLAARNHKTIDDAAVATACNVLYILAINADTDFEKDLSRDEFEIFVRGLRNYSAYRIAVAELRRPAEINNDDLAEADRLVTGLIARGVGKRFPSAYLLGAITAIAKNDPTTARNYLDDCPIPAKDPAKQQTQQVIASIRQNLPQSIAAAGPSVASLKVTQQRHRPVQPGISAAGEKVGTGTICCVVQLKSDPSNRYLLSADHVFGNAIGSHVMQPSLMDGGTSPGDDIAQVVKSFKKDSAAAAIALVSDKNGVTPACLGIGAFTGVGTANVGDTVTLAGRTSGVVKGKITAVSVTVDVSDGQPFKFVNLIECVGVSGSALVRPGDSGGPVVNEKNELIGMAYAGSDQKSYLMPIQPVLQELDAELVLK